MVGVFKIVNNIKDHQPPATKKRPSYLKSQIFVGFINFLLVSLFNRMNVKNSKRDCLDRFRSR